MQVSFKRIFALLLVSLLCLLPLAGCGASAQKQAASQKESYDQSASDQDYDQDDQDYDQDYDQDGQDYDQNDKDYDQDYDQDGQDYDQDYDQDDQDYDQDYNQDKQKDQADGSKDQTSGASLDKDGTYTSKEDVASYLAEYGELPQNFITKKEARKLGWSGGSLEPYAPGKCIGGDHFGNYEGNLPEVDGRSYYECDIDTLGAKSRGPKRIVYSDDGQIYYTEDHYNTFTLLYGDDEE